MHPDEQEDNLEQVLQRLESLAERIERGAKSDSSETKYREALKDAAKTLEATKNTFKSRQLKALRERIEAVLNEA